LNIYHIFLATFLVVLTIGIFIAVLPVQALSEIGISSTYADALRIAVIIVFGLASIRLLSAAIINYGKNKPRMDEHSVPKVVTLFGYAAIIVLLLSALNVNITGLLVGAGFLGIVIGLASQTTLGNLFAGISMMAAKPFAEGDRVTFSTWQYGLLPPSYTHNQLLPGYTGTIMNLGLIYTRIKLDEGTIIFVPNGVLNQAVIVNYTVSDIVEIKIRVELDNKVQFDSFKHSILKNIGASKKLGKLINGTVNVAITDISTSNYGVAIYTTARIENEKFVRSEIAAIALDLLTNVKL